MAEETWKSIWPEWKIVGKPIGQGSFGEVYKAERREYDVVSRAAIKVIQIPQNEAEIDSLRAEGLSQGATKEYLQEIVRDFVQEIQLMESLKAVQNIVSVEDYKVEEKTDTIGWTIYIRMELLQPFNDYICSHRMTEDEVIRLGMDLCTALELCEKRNIIHRDIKPENIFVNDFGNFKLGDFGIARKLENMTGGLSQKGTPNYMAPEVERGSRYDQTVDLYSLGLVLYFLMNRNRLPFLETEQQLKNPYERTNALRRRLNGEPLRRPCDASPAMAEVILKACAYAPGDRFASATEMKDALRSVSNGTYRTGRENRERYEETVNVRPPKGDGRGNDPYGRQNGGAYGQPGGGAYDPPVSGRRETENIFSEDQEKQEFSFPKLAALVFVVGLAAGAAAQAVFFLL